MSRWAQHLSGVNKIYKKERLLGSECSIHPNIVTLVPLNQGPMTQDGFWEKSKRGRKKGDTR